MIWFCLFLWAIAGMMHFDEMLERYPGYRIDRFSWLVVIFFPTYILLFIIYAMLWVVSFFVGDR